MRKFEVVKTGLSYGQAMHRCIMSGANIAREHWGGYWTLEHTRGFTVPVLKAYLKDGESVVPAIAYNEDILACDWCIVELKEEE